MRRVLRKGAICWAAMRLAEKKKSMARTSRKELQDADRRVFIWPVF